MDEFKLEENDVFELDDVNYIALNISIYYNKKYCFANELVDGETPTSKFVFFEVDKDGVELIEDEELIKDLLPIFTNNINKLMTAMNIENEGE